MENSKSNLKKGLLFGAMAGCLWGTLSIFLTFLLDAGLSNVAASSIGPMMVIIYFGGKLLLTNRKAFAIGWKNILILLVGGGIANAAVYFAFAQALNSLSAGIFSILDFSQVFFLMLLSSAIFKYKITKGKVISLLLAVIGLMLVLNVFTGMSISLVGLGWMVVTWVGNCAIALIIKWALNHNIENDAVIVYYSIGAALIYWVSCSPAEVVRQMLSADSVGKMLLAVLAYGVITQILANYAWVKSFSLLDPAVTNMMNAFSPIVATILGYFLYKQKVSLLQILGIAIIIGAVAVLNKTAADEL